MNDSVINESKVLCLILAEHEKLYKNEPLLKQKISLLEELNNKYILSDSIKNEQIRLFNEKIESDSKQIKKLQTYKKCSFIGGALLFILGLLL